MRPLLLLTALVFVTARIVAAEAKMIAFKISGGTTVTCACTDSGPLPAESGPYKLIGAGFALGPDPSGKKFFLIFGFDLVVNETGKPTHISVEDVSGEAASSMVDDNSPHVKNHAWQGNAKPMIISEQSTPWLYDPKPTIKIFRVTISAKGKQDVVLYQPAWYPAPTKAQIVAIVTKNG